MQRLTYRYRLYPTKAQQTCLQQTLHTCCDLYNSLVNWRRHDYEILGCSPSCNEQINALPGWKENHPELESVFSQVLQDVARRVQKAYDGFFRRVAAGETPGYPRFKGRGHYDSFTYPQAGFSLGEGYLGLSKIGKVRAVIHRPLGGTMKTCTLRRQAGKWYACIACEVEPEPLPACDLSTGIDVGLHHFAALSDGTFLDNPRFFRREEKALAKAQRKRDACPKPSPARTRANKVVSRIHARIRHKRHDFLHKASHQIVQRYGRIRVERLQLSNLLSRPKPVPEPETGGYLPNGACRKSGLNKSIADAAWGTFLFLLSYKAARAGREYAEVDPSYTSQECLCGHRQKKRLAERVHSCERCGLVLDRDTLSAQIIELRAALPPIKGLSNKGVGLHTLAAPPA